MLPSITTESSGLFSVTSTLSFKAGKEEKVAQFHCEVRYFVPGGMRMIETNHINITIYCEFHNKISHITLYHTSLWISE